MDADGSPAQTYTVTSNMADGRQYLAQYWRLARPLKRSVTVTYGTRNRTAVAGRDYARSQGTLRFRPGVTARYIRVPVYARPRVTDDSFFVVRLGHAVGTSISRSVGRGRIRR